MEYKYRIADQMLAKKLASKGAILIEGPKCDHSAQTVPLVSLK